MSVIVYIGVGSNVADGHTMVDEAVNFLRKRFRDVCCSCIYTTPSVSAGDDSVYFNCVVRCAAEDVKEMNAVLKAFETDRGREHGGRAVTIDLDIVVADGKVVRPADFARSYFRIGYDQIADN